MKTAILIDGNNIGYGIHSMLGAFEWMPNWDIIIERLKGNDELISVVYFREGDGISDKLRNRFDWKWNAVVKPCGKNVDVSLTIAAIELANKADRIIICSGDGDFAPLLRYLRERYVRVEVASLKHSLSDDLAYFAHKVHYITEEDCFRLDKEINESQNNISHAQ